MSNNHLPFVSRAPMFAQYSGTELLVSAPFWRPYSYGTKCTVWYSSLSSSAFLLVIFIICSYILNFGNRHFHVISLLIFETIPAWRKSSFFMQLIPCRLLMRYWSNSLLCFLISFLFLAHIKAVQDGLLLLVQTKLGVVRQRRRGWLQSFSKYTWLLPIVKWL